jgi:hypothetical protein
MMPQFPLYIVSKGRYDSRLTAKSLEEMNCPYNIVVEEQEYSLYKEKIKTGRILVLDKSYKEKYQLLDDLGLTKSTGPGPARNFAWDHSISEGHKWHWVMDDNIRGFYRNDKNQKLKVLTPTYWRLMEDFVLRYVNVGMAGPNYNMFIFTSTGDSKPPFTINTRIYSCNLIRNDLPFRWRGRYQEDTILSLDMLKAGWCTIQFNAFLQNKQGTQLLKGGNTAEFYESEGTAPKAKMMVIAHPDVSRINYRFSRIHHHVDYSSFKKNLKLIRKPESEITSMENALTLVKVKHD